MENYNKEYCQLEDIQEKKLRNIISYAYGYVPYYKNLFDRNHLKPSDIQSFSDLQKIEILDKGTINNHRGQFSPSNLDKIKYISNVTGGSTGTPFRYRYTKEERSLAGCLLYRGWSQGGYELGDRMVFLSGSSLGVNSSKNTIDRVQEFVRNIKKLSAFNMSEEIMEVYQQTINSYKPSFIRGYASSIYFFSQFLEFQQLPIHKPKAIFTTSDKLFPKMRSKIESVFACPVYDGYGLNDGGISAYENKFYDGMRIDTERGYLEVVDSDGNQIEEGEGNVLATSLLNYAMPFIRYNTGDRAYIKRAKDGTRLIKEVLGRQYEFLTTPSGKNIHGGFFTHVFWEIEGVKRFQVIQKQKNQINVIIEPEQNFERFQLQKIDSCIKQIVPDWEILYDLESKIVPTKAGKHKFVINEVDTCN